MWRQQWSIICPEEGWHNSGRGVRIVTGMQGRVRRRRQCRRLLSDWEMLRGKLCEINVFSLQPLRALLDFKRDARALFEGAVSARCDRRKMDEDIFAILALDEAESFCCVEPLYGACFFHV